MKKMKQFLHVFSLFLLMVLVVSVTLAQSDYQPDVLGERFLQRTIQQADDYEGKVVCTLVKNVSVDTSRRAVLYVHGFNDYFFQTEMAARYEQQGIRFYAIDLRKYGRSYRSHQKFNNVRDLSEYFADIDTALRIIRSEGADHVLLSGHSTGGLITALYAHRHPNSPLFQALYLNSPFFDMNEARFTEKWLLPLVVRRGAKKPNKRLKGGFSPFYGWSLHVSEKGEWVYNLDWKPHRAPSVNFGWIRAICLAQQEVHAGLVIDKPVLVMHAHQSIYSKRWSDELFTGDAVLSVYDIHRFSERISGLCTIRIIENGMHDLVLSQSTVRESVYAQLFTWLRTHL